MSSHRFFKNPLPDYESSSTIPNNGNLPVEIKNSLISCINELFSYWQNYVSTFPANDISVYTGKAGAALLYLKVYETKLFPNSEQYLEKALQIVESSSAYCRKIKVPTFMCGEVGLLTTTILIYDHLKKNHQELIQKIVSIQSSILNINSDLPDEILYGRAGYLYSLLLIRSKIPSSQSIISDELIRNTIKAILNSGIETASKQRSQTPLAYFWHGKPYMGAAHGYAGILYILLVAIEFVDEKDVQTLIKPTIEWICSQQYESGNFPSSLGGNEDKLVHWCHGAPGFIYLLTTYHSMFNDQNFLDRALKAGDLIWQKGLLKKGYGLCHGTAGNAYGFLNLFSATKDPKHLHRALKFAEWCCDYGKHDCRTPDTPFSLFEGMAGTIYFLLDILEPSQAKFPAFQLN